MHLFEQDVLMWLTVRLTVYMTLPCLLLKLCFEVVEQVRTGNGFLRMRDSMRIAARYDIWERVRC